MPGRRASCGPGNAFEMADALGEIRDPFSELPQFAKQVAPGALRYRPFAWS